MIFSFVPYQQVGRLHFGMSRKEVKEICGESASSYMHGYPVEDRFLDDYGYMHTLCNNRELLEGVELFPDISPKALILKYDQFEILLSKNPDDIVEDVILHDLHCYDEEDEYMEERKL